MNPEKKHLWETPPATPFYFHIDAMPPLALTNLPSIKENDLEKYARARQFITQKIEGDYEVHADGRIEKLKERPANFRREAIIVEENADAIELLAKDKKTPGVVLHVLDMLGKCYSVVCGKQGLQRILAQGCN